MEKAEEKPLWRKRDEGLRRRAVIKEGKEEKRKTGNQIGRKVFDTPCQLYSKKQTNVGAELGLARKLEVTLTVFLSTCFCIWIKKYL